MAVVVYNRGKYLLTGGGVIWGTNDVRCLLIGGASLPAGASDPDLNTVTELLAVSGVTELTGSGYARLPLTGATLTEDDTNDRVIFDADDASWPTISAGTARAVVVYDEGSGTDATRNLLTFHDTDFPKTTSGGDFVVRWPATGVIMGA